MTMGKWFLFWTVGALSNQTIPEVMTWHISGDFSYHKPSLSYCHNVMHVCMHIVINFPSLCRPKSNKGRYDFYGCSWQSTSTSEDSIIYSSTSKCSMAYQSLTSYKWLDTTSDAVFAMHATCMRGLWKEWRIQEGWSCIQV
mgnify:CR=1 FL=1